MSKQTALSKLSDEEVAGLAKVHLPYRTEAYEELLRRHQPKMFRLCIKMVGQAEDAEDLTQEVMLKVFFALKGFAGDAKISTWMYSIASNACLDHLRKRKRMALHHIPLDEAIPVQSQDPADVRILIAKAMSELSEKDRLIINLRYTVGLTLEEIAEALNMGLSAVKMRYYRAMEKLRISIGKPG